MPTISTAAINQPLSTFISLSFYTQSQTTNQLNPAPYYQGSPVNGEQSGHGFRPLMRTRYMFGGDKHDPPAQYRKDLFKLLIHQVWRQLLTSDPLIFTSA